MLRRRLIGFAIAIVGFIDAAALRVEDFALWADRKLKDMRPSLHRRAEQKRRPF